MAHCNDVKFADIAENVEKSHEWGVTPENDVLLRKGIDFLKSFDEPDDKHLLERFLFSTTTEPRNGIETHEKLAQIGDFLVKRVQLNELLARRADGVKS